MGSRRLELTVVSAENLPDIRRLGRMKVFAVVSVKGSVGVTNTDRERETNPRWDFPFVFNISEEELHGGGHGGGVDAVVDLYCETTLGGDKLIGRVVIPLKTLFHGSLSFPIAGGRLYIQYRFQDMKDFAPTTNHIITMWESAALTHTQYHFAHDQIIYNY